jgi:hypothetical protein
MQKSKLISILSKFSKDEIKNFGKFISSPYFLKGRDLYPAYRLLIKYYPDFDSHELTEEHFYKTINPGKKFEKSSSVHLIHVLFSELTALAEKFMVYSSIESGKYDYYYNIFLAESYRDKNINEPVLKILKKNTKLLDNDMNKFDYYMKRLETNMSVSGVLYTQNKNKDGYEYSRNNLMYIYAVIFDLMNKFVNEYFVNSYSYNFEYKGFALIKQFIETFSPELLRKNCNDDTYETMNLAILNYYMIKSRLDENDKTSLDEALKIYSSIFTRITRFVKWFNFVMLFNRFFGRIRFDRYYLEKANELVDFVWQKGIFSTYEKINLHLGSYHSALLVKAALVDSSELKNFIDKYTSELDPHLINEAKEYSYALLHFKSRNYSEALKIVSLKDLLNFPSLKINKHKLKICCLYELSYPEEALNAIDSFEHYLRNNKYVSEIIKTENLKFAAGIKKLIRIQFNEQADTDIEFGKIIELTENSVYGFWFREKINPALNKSI